MNEWSSIVKKSDNPRVLLMLSGGKDSIAALVKMAKEGIDVHAIHFMHKWSETIPSQEAKRICDMYGVKLIKYDFSDDFCKAVSGYTDGRPCLICKKQMYKCLERFLESGEYGWLAIGDNANDQLTIERMKSFDNIFGNDNYICSDYFGSEMGCKLPDHMHVLRPLIETNADDVERFLVNNNIFVQRIRSTGDKYFEYHREGCPVQFVEVGTPIDEQLMEQLKDYNCKITEFARKKGIRASVHMPSTFIITIPEGFEQEASDYLKQSGLYVDDECNSSVLEEITVYYAYIEKYNGDYFIYNSYNCIFNRFADRIGIKSTQNSKICNSDGIVLCVKSDKIYELKMIFDKQTGSVTIELKKTKESMFSLEQFSNLIIENFKTRKYVVKSID